MLPLNRLVFLPSGPRVHRCATPSGTWRPGDPVTERHSQPEPAPVRGCTGEQPRTGQDADPTYIDRPSAVSPRPSLRVIRSIGDTDVASPLPLRTDSREQWAHMTAHTLMGCRNVRLWVRLARRESQPWTVPPCHVCAGQLGLWIPRTDRTRRTSGVRQPRRRLRSGPRRRWHPGSCIRAGIGRGRHAEAKRPQGTRRDGPEHWAGSGNPRSTAARTQRGGPQPCRRVGADRHRLRVRLLHDRGGRADGAGHR